MSSSLLALHQAVGDVRAVLGDDAFGAVQDLGIASLGCPHVSRVLASLRIRDDRRFRVAVLAIVDVLVDAQVDACWLTNRVVFQEAVPLVHGGVAAGLCVGCRLGVGVRAAVANAGISGRGFTAVQHDGTECQEREIAHDRLLLTEIRSSDWIYRYQGSPDCGGKSACFSSKFSTTISSHFYFPSLVILANLAQKGKIGTCKERLPIIAQRVVFVNHLARLRVIYYPYYVSMPQIGKNTI